MTIRVPKEVQVVFDDFENKQESFGDYRLYQAIKNAFQPTSKTPYGLRKGWFPLCPIDL